ncbi:PD-(D/E)XK nuclease family protein [Oculatella sp. LEGE 06141]|uniref:PD-(D/E)XK nuclease family protein n=1 Tax=Oculatella sp. LEGE 06141 TaxID=1828648 RepID=UPI00187EAD0B|nr:PD-(D/E)XK nuclease family protein [Oculatella sp. LEGE 06141]MBE9181356.1 PD-(D/E)XK nuclease family protein [Oculatella sp. LEGE 06141]
MRLSQAQLNLLETCPRKFQHTYLDQLGSPMTPEQQDRLTWGSQFHLLMQQRELGLPMVPLDAEEGQLNRCMTAFVAAAPDLFQPRPGTRQSEHRRTLEFHGYLLTVIYDLLILSDRQAHILDWKTYPRPSQSERLRQNWQTRLYRFVLAETSAYEPEQILMTYWFIQAEHDQVLTPQSLSFPYTAEQQERDRQDLTTRLNQLTEWLQRYDQGEPFPQINETSSCPSCHFVARCQREAVDLSAESVDVLNLDDIQEVAL